MVGMDSLKGFLKVAVLCILQFSSQTTGFLLNCKNSNLYSLCSHLNVRF